MLDLLRTLSSMANLDDLVLFEQGNARGCENVYLGVAYRTDGKTNIAWARTDHLEFPPYDTYRLMQMEMFYVDTYGSRSSMLWHPLFGEHAHTIHVDYLSFTCFYDEADIETIDDIDDDMIDHFLGLTFAYVHEVKAHITEGVGLYRNIYPSRPKEQAGLFDHIKFGNEQGFLGARITELYERLIEGDNTIFGSPAASVVARLYDLYQDKSQRETLRCEIFNAIKKSQQDGVLNKMTNAANGDKKPWYQFILDLFE